MNDMEQDYNELEQAELCDYDTMNFSHDDNGSIDNE